MMRITAQFHSLLGPPKNWFKDIQVAVRSTPALLRVMGREALLDSARRFAEEGPGWTPRKESTEERQEERVKAAEETAHNRAIGTVRGKLRRELKRARKKFPETAVERRYAILKTFEHYVAGGHQDISFTETVKDEAAVQKRLGVLKERLGRAEDAAGAQRGKILGGLGSANRMKVEGKQAVISNKARNKKGEPYSAVHNEGGKVGNDAEVEKREFLGASDQLLDACAEKVLDYITKGDKK